jgi:RNA polymerase sigma-70 factor (ECF subfamily)
LAYFQGYTHREIAEMLEQPLGTVKTRIRLAIQKLRSMLQESPI